MTRDEEQLTEEELEQAEGEPLPDREEMALWPDLSGGFPLPVDPPDAG
ncbi:MAG TPA: hypothetical protein VGQ84_07760 [Gaiellaceae bacterium]|jgi:hypothetical protein|nr:hypothetical protein [Gaiellaceae bacterium]